MARVEQWADSAESTPTALSLTRRVAVVLLIFVGIQLLNQFLMATGQLVESAFPAGAPLGRFTTGVYQQTVQAAVGLVLARRLLGQGAAALGINTARRRQSLRLFGGYAPAWLAVIALYLAVAYHFFPAVWDGMRSAELPPPATITATLLFQAFFPGIGEEILFRGCIISLLVALVFTDPHRRRADAVGVVVVSSLTFALAHVYFTVAPWRIIHFDALQIANALGNGAFYAVAYRRTGSLLAPFLAHNFSNTTVSLVGYALMLG